MEIKRELPFDECDKCGNFIMDVRGRVARRREGTTMELVVRCRNMGKCKFLQKDEVKQDDAR